jgi:hypothetical protein
MRASPTGALKQPRGKKTTDLARAGARAQLQRTREKRARAKKIAARPRLRYPARENCRVRCRARYKRDMRERAN